ncbi:phage tail protein [Streptacidiphilus anmyonensis]|uniref:phage tail protein n=1 Tax=Streptacidiphilus anmyonensis TaxID=405782 RepID=UPI0005AA76A8|nr:phage tail protein [Streptacidiphilus anmyonensis]
MADTRQPSGVPSVVTASRFLVSADAVKVLVYFSELGGITSEVESTEYISASSNKGEIVHSRQFGKTKPPTVVLKRGVDGGGEMWAWHRMVLEGLDAARVGATLTMMDAGGKARGIYELTNAWPTKLEVTGMKAGASEVVYESVTLTCDKITYIVPAG